MKTTKEDFENAAKNKKEVKFGKSTTYDVDKPIIDSKKVIIYEQDISDARDETEKIKQKI